MYIFNGKKLTEDQAKKFAEETGRDLQTFLEANPDIQEDPDFGPQNELGKPEVAVEKVAPAVTEDTALQLENGSSGLTAYKDLTDEQKKQLNKQKKVDLGNSPEEIAKRRKISRAEQADILSTDIELEEIVLTPRNETKEIQDFRLNTTLSNDNEAYALDKARNNYSNFISQAEERLSEDASEEEITNEAIKIANDVERGKIKRVLSKRYLETIGEKSKDKLTSEKIDIYSKDEIKKRALETELKLTLASTVGTTKKEVTDINGDTSVVEVFNNPDLDKYVRIAQTLSSESDFNFDLTGLGFFEFKEAEKAIKDFGDPKEITSRKEAELYNSLVENYNKAAKNNKTITLTNGKVVPKVTFELFQKSRENFESANENIQNIVSEISDLDVSLRSESEDLKLTRKSYNDINKLGSKAALVLGKIPYDFLGGAARIIGDGIEIKQMTSPGGVSPLAGMVIGNLKDFADTAEYYSKGADKLFEDYYKDDVSFEDAFSSGSNLAEFAAQEVVGQFGNIAMYSLGMWPGSIGIGVTSYESQRRVLEEEEKKNILGTKKSALYKAGIATGYATAEVLFAAIPTINILKKATAGVPTKGILDGLSKFTLRQIGKTAVKDTTIEMAGESATVVVQAGIDMAIGRKEVNLSNLVKDVPHAAFSALLLSGTFTTMPIVDGIASRVFSDYNSNQEAMADLDKINKISLELKNIDGRTKEAKAKKATIEELTNSFISKLEKKRSQLKTNLSKDGYEMLLIAETRKLKIRNEAKDIIEGLGNDSSKKESLSALKQEFDYLDNEINDFKKDYKVNVNLLPAKELKRINALAEQKLISEGKETDKASVKVQAEKIYLSESFDTNIDKTKKAINAVNESGTEQTFNVYKTKSEAIEGFKTSLEARVKSGKITEAQAEAELNKVTEGIKSGQVNGFNYSPDDSFSDIVVVKENSINNGKTGIGLHELGHTLFTLGFAKDPQAFKGMAETVLSWLKENNESAYNRVSKNTKLDQAEGRYDEVLTNFLEEVSSKRFDLEAKKNQGILGLLGLTINNGINKSTNTDGDFVLQGDENVVEFLNSLSKKVNTETLSPKDVSQLKKGKVKEKADSDKKLDINTKESRTEITPKAKEFINLNKEGVITNEGLVDIINSPSSKSEDKFGAIEAVVEGNWPVISNAIKFNPTGSIPIDAVKTAVTEQIQGIFPGRNVPLFKGYNPDQGKVNTVIGTFLGPRQAEILERAKKIGGITQEGTSIDSKEAKQTVDTSSEIDLDKKKEKPVKPKESLRESIPISDAVVQKVRDAVVKTFGTKLGSVENKQDFKEELRKAFRTELKTTIAKEVLGTRDSYETFLRDNFEAIYEAIPQEVINKRFKAFKEPVLDKNGKQLREKTAQGNAIFEKKKISKAEFIKNFLGREVGASTKGTRKDALAETLAEEFAFDATPETIQTESVETKRKFIDEKQSTKKVTEAIGRPIDLKFSLSEASQAKDVNASGKIAGIKGKITINDSNRVARQLEILKSIIESNIPTIIFEAGRFGNFGRWNRRGKIVKGIFIPIPKIGTKYFKTKDGTLIKENSKEYKKAVKDGNFLPGRGGLYYGVKDPAYIEARDAAKKNDKLYPNLKKPKRVNMINAFTEAGQAQSKANMDTLETMANVLAKAVADGTMTKENAALFIASSYQATTGLIKIAAPFKYRSKIFEYGLSGKQRKGDKYREEHNPPASVIGSNLIWAIANNKVSEIMPSIRKNFNQTQLSKKDDEKIDNAKLDATLPIGTTILDNPVTRIAASGINLNSIVNVETGKTLAEENGVGVETKFENNLEVYNKQNELILKLNSDKNFTASQAKKQIDQFVKIAPSIVKASKSNNDKSAFKFSKAPTNKVTIDTAATTDKALNIARDLDAPIKKIRVFDFDDTLAQTKSDVLFTMPDGTEGKLNAEQFASDGSTLLGEGAVFDFSEFNKVTEGKKGPLFKVAQTIAAKRGTEDVFVLTARAPESQLAIYEFLKSQGLDIPLKNITGLGNSTGEAKARWIVDKAADGYNDFYFADDAPQNVKAVKEALSVIDVKSKTQQAKIKFSKSLDLNKDFNDIIENKTGIGSDKTYSRVKAEVAGASKGKFNFFIPPSAEDFVGLLYSTLGKGDVGDAQMAWYKSHLLNPFARAMENLANDRANMMQDFRGLKKSLKIVPKNLRKKIKDSNFTKEQAVRAYIWDKQGMEIPGISQKDQKDLVDFVNADAELVVFGDQLIEIGKGDAYAAPDAGWVAGNIGTDFIKALNTTKRSKYLETWQQNVDQIFSEANLNKLEAAYGANYREAMVDMLKRMRTGRNTSSGSDRLAARFTDWLTNSVGAIMFFNTRSAVLQTISAVNFINFSDNNVLKAGAAFANQPQYWKDFKKLFNSPFLLDRRSGLKLNVNEADIAAMAKGPGNSARNVIAGILKAGFLPTQLADSFAIASGGASFYRNRIKALQKEGLTEAEAEEQAFRDFREIAEESQQSSRPDKISQQQAGPLGRVILAFANTPAQYARLIKKAASDLKNSRGDAKTNISKIIYYGVAQNLLFSALQQALFAIAFDDEEEEEKKNEKYFNIVNGMSDSVLRGIGIGGAIVSTVKNTALRLAKEADKKGPKYQDAVVKGILQISPPISSKVGKLQSAGRSYSWNQEEMRTRGWSIDNPAYLANANVISALTNVPLDRAIKKITNIVDAGNEDIEYYKRVALVLGWSAWELDIDKKGGKVTPPKTDMDKLYDLNKKQQIDSLTSLGISKKQIKLLKLEEDRVNAILNPKSIKPIKVSKKDSLFGLNKKDQVKALEKLGLTKKEIRALRLESDRVEAIINQQKEKVE